MSIFVIVIDTNREDEPGELIYKDHESFFSNQNELEGLHEDQRMISIRDYHLNERQRAALIAWSKGTLFIHCLQDN